MGDHYLVEKTQSWLGDWNDTEVPMPDLVDRDDAQSDQFLGRQVAGDLKHNAILSISSSYEPQETPIGTEYNLRVRDGVNVRLEGAHVEQRGTITDGTMFSDMVDEAKRLIRNHKHPEETINGRYYHTVVILNQVPRLHNHKDYYRYDFDVEFRGYENL
jgi:hypothetical protein